MSTMKLLTSMFLALAACGCAATPVRNEPMRVLVITSRAKDHLKMIAAAGPVLRRMGEVKRFVVDVTDDDSVITDANLARYRVVVQLQEAPFDLKPAEQLALQRFIESGHGWVGIHAAGLTGRQFLLAGMPYWDWFEGLLGGVVYSPHPRYQKGVLVIEDRRHPVMRGLPERMEMADEWYEFDRSPRPRVRVLASADESTYRQNRPMGDHPMVWVNEKYHRAVYIAVGHDASAWENPDYVRMVSNAIVWAGE